MTPTSKSGRRWSASHPSQWDEQSLGLIRQVCVNSLSMKTNEEEENSWRCTASFISFSVFVSLCLSLPPSESWAVNNSGAMLSSAGVQVNWPHGYKTWEYRSKSEREESLSSNSFRELQGFFFLRPILSGLRSVWHYYYDNVYAYYEFLSCTFMSDQMVHRLMALLYQVENIRFFF